MVLWPAGLALVAVWNIFRDPAIDYRLVVAGAVLPDLVDAPFGGARVAHTLAASVVLLLGVMLATRGRRHLRRRLLALPIGTFIHLVVDGVWTSQETFWWPAFGATLEAGLPAIEGGLGLLAAKEMVGLGAVAWFWVRFGLGRAEVRSGLLRTGRLPRDAAGPGPAASC